MGKHLVKCRNCKNDVEKKTRRCPYCGILNPTVTIKDVLITTAFVIVVMYSYVVFIK